jgi:glycerol-3-phosphate dehydrogenase
MPSFYSNRELDCVSDLFCGSKQNPKEKKMIRTWRSNQAGRILVSGITGCIGYYYLSLEDDTHHHHELHPDSSVDAVVNSFWNRSTATTTTRLEAEPSASRWLIPPPMNPILTRTEQLERLQQQPSTDAQWDVLVIGGGATGSGVALDAVTRGLNVAMIDRGDFGNETSARSTKLLWAGIRYIGTAVAGLLRVSNITRPVAAIQDAVSEFQMVLGAHKERKILLENNPHLTNWVPIAIPITSWWAWPPPLGHPLFATAPIILPLFLKFYDSLSGFSCPPSHVMGVQRSKRKFPVLSEDAKYFAVFYEGQHNDARTNTYIALTAAEYGACIANYVEMIGIVMDHETGKAIGINCRDNMTGQEFPVHAKAIIFCGGPFTDELRKIEDSDATEAVAAAAGTHIVVRRVFFFFSLSW